MLGPKPLASLSSGLLARKGQARPAMRPQGVGSDDLGWNDMGVPPVLVERAALVEEVEAPAISQATAEHVARESASQTRAGKAAFTLRLDADRHLRLRLASALRNRSAQQLVTDALDAFLAKQPGLDALVGRLPHSNR
jgi:hypothetical protein